jgi:CheY-like chemotaxis protein
MKVRQVLLNLLSNAAKFTDEGSITVKAELRKGADEQDEVLVSVIDTGPGVAPEDQKKLFQPFSQVDGSLTRKTGGSGLGLSICNYLVQMHGGRIGLRSTIGQGSTFYFSLPIRNANTPLPASPYKSPELLDVQAAEMPHPSGGGQEMQASLGNTQDQAADTASAPTSPGASEGALHPNTKADDLVFALEESTLFATDIPAQDGKNLSEPPGTAPIFHQGIVLAIDQDHQVIEFYRRYLSRHGYTVVAVTELEAAVEAARGIQPAAITLDISMQCDKDTKSGKLDGWQVLKEIKSDPAIQKIPVVICSLLDERERALGLGASDYLIKPILEDDLAKAIERLVASMPSRVAPEADFATGDG